MTDLKSSDYFFPVGVLNGGENGGLCGYCQQFLLRIYGQCAYEETTMASGDHL